MSCHWVKSQIPLYLYNELDDPDRVEIEQHAESCPACSAVIERERALCRMLDHRRAAAADPGLLAECRRRLAEALEEQPRPGFAQQILTRAWHAFYVLRPRFRPAFAAFLLLAGFAGGWAVSSYRGGASLLSGSGGGPELSLRSGGADDFNINNISSIQAINADPQGNLEIVFDTTRRRVVRGAAQDPRVEQLLVYAANNYANAGIRLDSIELLKDRAGEEDVRASLIAALRTDQNAGVRLKAVEALREFSGDPQVKLALREALRRDENPGVRIEAIDQLGKLRDASAVPLLQQVAAGDPNSYVRLRSASALRDLNAPEIY